jgi:glycosyltransferase involved in cell wall biosynthesis
MLLGMARRLRNELGAKVVCTLAGEDAFLDSLVEPYQSQAWALLRERADDAAALIAVSRYYAEQMRRRLQLSGDDARLRVVYNGIELDGYTPGDSPPADPTIGFLARLHPGKGMHTLVEAFIEMKRRGRVPNLKLRLAGAMTREDDAFVDQQRKTLTAAGVMDDVSIEPNLTQAQKLAFYRSISAFSVPATYGEAFGLYVLEALAAGVPVVQPRHGAFTELLEHLGGGILCEADSPAALVDALEITLLRHDESRRSAEAARQRVLAEFNVDRMAAGVAEVFNDVTGETGA